MATKLTFQHFICEEGTSEQGDESPYFLTWVGNVVNNVSTVHYTRQAVWNDNVPENPSGIWLVNEVVVNNFDLSPARTLALALMIEEDEGFDLSKVEARRVDSSDSLTSVREKMAQLLNTHFAQSSNIQDSNVIRNFQLTFASAVRGFLDNPVGGQDDLMEDTDSGTLAARKINLAAPNKLPEVIFRDSSGGRYRARFKLD
jgi:hypothetical protein